MKITNKLASLALIVAVAMVPLVTNTNKVEVKADAVRVLNINNWEDYISDYDEEYGTIDIIGEFEKYASNELGEEVKVVYSTFGTNENMYNELQLTREKKTVDGKVVYEYAYDLVCPSDYMIQKMIQEDMLEKYDMNDDGSYKNLPSYNENGLDIITDIFDTYGWSEYAVGYMWGTMGYVYNPELVDEADANKWGLLWNEEYKNLGTIKDSVRDTYVLAVGYVYSEELYVDRSIAGNENKVALNTLYEDGVLTTAEYQQVRVKIFNNIKTSLADEFQSLNEAGLLSDKGLTAVTDLFKSKTKSTVDLVASSLKTLKENIYGYEVDSGKTDMATGKIAINYAWSGDAVYTLDVAEGDDLYLNYSVPNEGSNIWFDGWVMPRGADTELAQMFVDFISMPVQATNNMTYIGYTSAVGGSEVLEWLVDYYELSDEQTNEYNVEVDLSKYFPNGEKTIYYTTESGRQLDAQYPPTEIVERCAIMTHITQEELELLNAMWSDVKVAEIPMWVMVGVPVAIVLVIGVVLAILYFKKNGKGGNGKSKYGELVGQEKV